ncbi:MAG: SDR family oxidoreductase [Anaerolineales bacterium]|jgi:dihydroflavonol-4-reductase|nr:SDR family oxidoreductase [Anaerolineales bacterium]
MNLVTGATGHIGNVLIRHLLQRGQKVRAFVLPNDNLTPLDGLDVEIVYGDVLDPASIERALSGVDLVYHMAAIITIMPGKNDLVQRINVEGTRNMLSAAKKARIRRFIYTSSIHAIQRAPHGTTITESLPYDPHNPYGAYDISKAQASLLVEQAARDGLDTVLICPTGVIGPYDFHVSLMGAGILRYWDNKEVLYFAGGYDYVDVRDVADGMIAAAEKGRSGESYLLSGGYLSNTDLVETGRKLVGGSYRLRELPIPLVNFLTRIMPLYYRMSKKSPQLTPYAVEVLQSNASISHAKATRELGYQPRPLLESLQDSLGWFKENTHLLISHP